MSGNSDLQPFLAQAPDAAGVLSWIHIGDLHITEAGQQNDLDLQLIVEKINSVFAGSVSFVYLPGDVAEHGNSSSYGVARKALDRLRVPWCAIPGDHDVHEQSHANFLDWMASDTHYAFTAGDVRFLALNAFDVAHPASFSVLPEQLAWAEEELVRATLAKQRKIMLLHCYPSDLKTGRDGVEGLVKRFDVQLIDMGHTHYNEIANDGKTLYTATRSTGQIEEGPVGFSVTNLDGDSISWRFFELAEMPAVMITAPSDERLMTKSMPILRRPEGGLRVRAKAWGKAGIDRVWGSLAQGEFELKRVAGSEVWEASQPISGLEGGVYPLRVWVRDAEGGVAEDAIRVRLGDGEGPTGNFRDRDQDNALAAWPEHGLLGTQLGPNKNGRKW